jgi:hypothetical protein
MRTIKQTSQFKRDLKREAKGLHRQTLQREFVRLVETPANDQPLAEKHRTVSQAASTTGILPIFICHSLGSVLWKLEPRVSTATVTGMSLTSNS